jgi:outer membrane receptor protein involved in Fe transport
MLSLGVFRDDVGRVGNLTLSQFDLDPTQIGSSAAPGEHTYTQGEMVNFNYLKDFSGWQWRQQLFQQSNQIDSKASFATLIADKKLGAVTEFNLNFDHQVMVLGLEQKYQNATYNDNFGTSSQANQQSRAVYFSQLHHLEEAWGFSYGLRYDDIDWDFVQTGFTNIPFTRRKSNRLSPKLGITYQAQPDQQFFFNYSEAFKAPRPNTFFNVGGGTYSILVVEIPYYGSIQ